MSSGEIISPLLVAARLRDMAYEPQNSFISPGHPTPVAISTKGGLRDLLNFTI